MYSLSEKYEIKDLYVVKFKKELINTIGIEYNEFINYFKPDVYYIIEIFRNEENDHIYETYKECIAGEDFYKRDNTQEFEFIPDIFETMELLSHDYLDEEEIQTGIISTSRIFQIFQELNIKKVKKLGRR